MFKLSDDSWNTLDQGIQIAFGDKSTAVIHYYKPDVLAAANSPTIAMNDAAPMPTPTEAPAIPFGPAAA